MNIFGLNLPRTERLLHTRYNLISSIDGEMIGQLQLHPQSNRVILRFGKIDTRSKINIEI